MLFFWSYEITYIQINENILVKLIEFSDLSEIL